MEAYRSINPDPEAAAKVRPSTRQQPVHCCLAGAGCAGLQDGDPCLKLARAGARLAQQPCVGLPDLAPACAPALARNTGAAARCPVLLQVPILIDGDTRLVESMVIVEYLEQKVGGARRGCTATRRLARQQRRWGQPRGRRHEPCKRRQALQAAAFPSRTHLCRTPVPRALLSVRPDGPNIPSPHPHPTTPRPQYPEPALLPGDAAAAARARLFIEAVGSQLTGPMLGVLRADSKTAVEAGTAKLAAGLKASSTVSGACCAAALQQPARR